MAFDAIRFGMALRTMTTAELRAMNHAVVGEIRHRQNLEQHAAGVKFHPGQLASFSKNGRRVFMRIERINTKTIVGPEVDAFGARSGYTTWRVAPTFLTPHTAPPARPAASTM